MSNCVRVGIVASIACLGLVAGCSSQGSKASGETAKEHEPMAAPSALDPIKALAGTWECDTDGDGKMDCTAVYKVSANGHTVTENLFVGTPHEMVTAFHMDGGAVMATHYCSIGNQPRMRDLHPTGSTFMFEFLDCTNLKSPNDPHMHSLKMEIVDADHLVNTWTHYADGKPSAPMAFRFTRKRG